jgi:CubicO group peptidase (beta-lactamase class C family)
VLNFLRGLRHLIRVLLVALSASVAAQNAPRTEGVDQAPDAWLLAAQGQPWWYKTTPSPSPTPLRERSVSANERAIIDRAKDLLAGKPARALALLDGDNVIYSGFNAPANGDSILFGFSVGKTVTSMAVGLAICAGNLRYDTKASDVLPELRGKHLGKATVRDMLMMSSGAADPMSDSTIWTPEQFKRWSRGELTILESVTEDRVTQAQRGLFNSYEPGEHFSYKSTDPMVLGLMISRTTGMPYSQWVQTRILDPMGATRTGLIVQDKSRDGATDAGIRLRLEDWIRFAQWVKRSSKGTDCFANYVNKAMQTQQKNDSGRGRDFSGYGYLLWTEPHANSRSAWAFGHGGQLIGWDTSSDRIIIVFSNADSWKQDVFGLMNDWKRIKPGS